MSREDPSQQPALSGKLKSARASVEILVSSLPSDWSDVWSRVLRPPLFGFGDVVASHVRSDKEQLWCNALVRPFMEQLGGFPINPSGRSDVPLAKLQGFLAPGGGALWQFYTQNLEGQVVTRQGDHFILEPSSEGVSFSRRIPDFLERAWRLQQMLFPDGADAPKAVFDVRLQGASDLRQTQLSVGGKMIGYSNGPLIWQRMEWPGAQPQSGATLTIVRNDGRPNPPLTMGGEWGLFRLLQKGAIIDRDPRGRSFSVVWQPAGGERVRIDFRAVGSTNLLLELPLRPALEPPNAITAGGTGCRAGSSGLMAVDWAVTEGVTLLGKTPARADFIRINHGSPSAIAFDEWLQRNLEELVLGGLRTAPPSRFLFAPSGGGEALFGLVAPSRDKAGRVFPVALFVALPAGLARRAPHAIARAGAPFVAAARTLFEGLGALDYDALKEAVAALEMPAQDAYEAAEREVGEALARATPADCVERLFRDSADGVAAAALFTVTSAEREAAPKAAVFECPVQEATDALFWLALASRGAQGPLSFFWTDVAEPGAEGEPPPASRLLLCSAPPPPQTLLHLAAGKPKPGKLQVLSGGPGSPGGEGARRGPKPAGKTLGFWELGRVHRHAELARSRTPECLPGDSERLFCTRAPSRHRWAGRLTMTLEPRLPKVGDVIDRGKYRIDALIGEGGMGVVFAATHMQMGGKRRAIKWLLPSLARDENAVRRFLAEAQHRRADRPPERRLAAST